MRYSPTSMFLISKATQIVKTGWGLNYDMISTVGEYRYELPPEFQGVNPLRSVDFMSFEKHEFVQMMLLGVPPFFNRTTVGDL